MKTRMLVRAVLVTVAGALGQAARAENMATLAIAPGTAAVKLVPRWSVGGGLSGFTYLAQDLGLGAPGQFYSLRGTTIPTGGDASAFTRYSPLTGTAVPHPDIGGKLTPDSYSALTSADPNLGFGAINLYMIHHRPTGDYFTALVPGAAVASTVSDLKPMSGPGGPATAGAKGYFALTFAAANLGFGANMMYYLRSDAEKGTVFGALNPALAQGPVAEEALGSSGHTALAYAFANLGWGLNQMYYLRQDADTGYTILGTLGPATGKAADIANLGSVFTTLAFFPADLGFAVNQFYVTGTLTPNWQSISFAPIPDRAIGAGSFVVTPTASSGLPVTLKLAYGSIGSAAITGPVGGAFTVTPLSPGVITLQAIQAGQTTPVVCAYNALKQSFTASGLSLLSFTAQPSPLSQIALVGDTASFSAKAEGASAVTYQWRRAGTNITGNPSALTATLTLIRIQPADAASYDVVATNAAGSIVSNAAILAVNVAIPVITNRPLTADGRVTGSFSFTITATDNPTGFTARPLPAGLALNAATGIIAGIPTATGVTTVVLGATNPSGTGTANLTITVAPSGAPEITLPPVRQTATAGQGATFTVVAAGSPAPRFQWQRFPANGTTWENLVEGAGYSGVNGSTLTVGSLVPAMSGDRFRVAITNSAGVVTTMPVALTVVGTGPKVFLNPAAIAVNLAGVVYVADAARNTIEVITVGGMVSTLAGSGGLAGSQDGSGSAARFNQPSGLVLDASGNLYVADSGNATVRKISPAGEVRTLAGSPSIRGSADGLGAAAAFGLPSAIAIDQAGNVYVTDAFYSTVRVISAAGQVRTLAGSAGLTGDVDGTGSAARFNHPGGLAVDGSGSVYVADTYNNTVRKISPAGVVTTMAGFAGLPGSWDDVGSTGLFNLPAGLAVDSLGNVFVADLGNSTLRMVSSDGVVLTLAGNPAIAGFGDGTGGFALFNHPGSIALYSRADRVVLEVYVADAGNALVRHLTLDGLLVHTPVQTRSAAPLPVEAETTIPPRRVPVGRLLNEP
jgi:sugar lactone lactonase YvrE